MQLWMFMWPIVRTIWLNVCKAFFFLHFCSPRLSVSWQMKINSIPTYFSKRACSTKDLFYRKKKHIKEFWKKLTKKPQIFQWVEKCVSCFWLELKLMLKFCPIDLKLSLSLIEREIHIMWWYSHGHAKTSYSFHAFFTFSVLCREVSFCCWDFFWE